MVVVDHLNFTTENLSLSQKALDALGFVNLSGDVVTRNDTNGALYSVHARGGVYIALNSGINLGQDSQTTIYQRMYGDNLLQHMALRVEDIEQEKRFLEEREVQFVSDIIFAEDEFGQLRQCFTFPLAPGGKFFIELVQREFKAGYEQFKTPTCGDSYHPVNINYLWNCIEAAIEDGWWFNVDLFGNYYTLEGAEPRMGKYVPTGNSMEYYGKHVRDPRDAVSEI